MLFNWVKAHRQGKLDGADSKPKVSAEQMEIARLRAELALVKMERDIPGKGDPQWPCSGGAWTRRTRTSQRQRSEVRLHPASPAGVADLGAVPGPGGQRGRVSRALCSTGQASLQKTEKIAR